MNHIEEGIRAHATVVRAKNPETGEGREVLCIKPGDLAKVMDIDNSVVYYAMVKAKRADKRLRFLSKQVGSTIHRMIPIDHAIEWAFNKLGILMEDFEDDAGVFDYDEGLGTPFDPLAEYRNRQPLGPGPIPNDSSGFDAPEPDPEMEEAYRILQESIEE